MSMSTLILNVTYKSRKIKQAVKILCCSGRTYTQYGRRQSRNDLQRYSTHDLDDGSLHLGDRLTALSFLPYDCSPPPTARLLSPSYVRLLSTSDRLTALPFPHGTLSNGTNYDTKTSFFAPPHSIGSLCISSIEIEFLCTTTYSSRLIFFSRKIN